MTGAALMKLGRAPTTWMSPGMAARMPRPLVAGADATAPRARQSRPRAPDSCAGDRSQAVKCESASLTAARQQHRSGAVGIIGLGYVGLPLAVAFAGAGLTVVGVDTSTHKVAAVGAGRTYIEDVPSESLAALLASGRLVATTDATRLRDCGAILICVPTPLDEHRKPDLSYVTAAAETAIANLAPGALLVLESTT